MELHLFDQVADAVASLIAPEYEHYRQRSHRYGLKIWFGPQKPTRDHYECQMIDRRHLDGQAGWAIETGFHTEFADPAANDVIIDRLRSAEKTWRRKLGPDAELGPFLGRGDEWYRLSETWIEPETPDLVLELAGRLTDYIEVLQPLLAE